MGVCGLQEEGSGPTHSGSGLSLSLFRPDLTPFRSLFFFYENLPINDGFR